VFHKSPEVDVRWSREISTSTSSTVFWSREVEIRWKRCCRNVDSFEINEFSCSLVAMSSFPKSTSSAVLWSRCHLFRNHRVQLFVGRDVVSFEINEFSCSLVAESFVIRGGRNSLVAYIFSNSNSTEPGILCSQTFVEFFSLFNTKLRSIDCGKSKWKKT
jgi:hypothetical protein